MPVFYEFKISVADREDIKRSDDLADMGVKSEPEWRDSLCVINLDKIEGFHPYNDDETKMLFRNDSVIVFCKYKDVKDIFQKHYGVYSEK
jgi:hypothetical protein